MNKGDDIPKEVISELDSASRQLDAELAGEASGPSWISMRILYGDKGPDGPLEDVSALKMGLKASCSVGLRYTHEDAAGWLNYLQTFLRRCKFWYRDRMVLGDGCLRYIFWSTCYSCSVLHGHNPIRTWGPAANKGFRMLFGYETVNYDNRRYGKYFWREWNKINPSVRSFSMQKAVNVAQDFVQQHGLDQEGLTFDRIMLSNEGGGEEGSGQIEGPYVNETVVQFTQQINGIPVLLPGKGCVSVTVDNDGTVTAVKDSTRSIDRLTERLKNALAAPDEKTPIGEILDPEQLLAEAWQEHMKDWIVKGRMPVLYTIALFDGGIYI